MKTTLNNAGGNRALVCYLNDPDYGETNKDAFANVVAGVLQSQDFTLSGGGVYVAPGYCALVNIALTNGETWRRNVSFYTVDGDVLVGVYFYSEPDPIEVEDVEDVEGEEEEEEPEPPSIPQLVNAALEERFGIVVSGASSFVINPNMTEFELEVE